MVEPVAIATFLAEMVTGASHGAVPGKPVMAEDACLLGSGRLILDIDCFEAVLGDAKRHRSAFVVASPDRERATGADLLQQAGADELIDNLSSGLAFNVCRQFNSAIIALRSRGQNDELRIGKS
jgi:hypothetical protein